MTLLFTCFKFVPAAKYVQSTPVFQVPEALAVISGDLPVRVTRGSMIGRSAIELPKKL